MKLKILLHVDQCFTKLKMQSIQWGWWGVAKVSISSISFLPFSGRQHKMTHKGWYVVALQHNQTVDQNQSMKQGTLPYKVLWQGTLPYTGIFCSIQWLHFAWQQKLRSACASAQADLGLCCQLRDTPKAHCHMANSYDLGLHFKVKWLCYVCANSSVALFFMSILAFTTISG